MVRSSDNFNQLLHERLLNFKQIALLERYE